jgi:hypothetical protein
VPPLGYASGAGAKTRQLLGTAVFGGMIGVTGFGLILTPAGDTLVQRIGASRKGATTHQGGSARLQQEAQDATIGRTRAQPGH